MMPDSKSQSDPLGSLWNLIIDKKKYDLRRISIAFIELVFISFELNLNDRINSHKS